MYSQLSKNLVFHFVIFSSPRDQTQGPVHAGQWSTTEVQAKHGPKFVELLADLKCRT